MAEEADFDFVKAIYPFTGEGQAVPLPFAESTVVLVAERTEDGWCRGFACAREGWFPTSYVKPLANSELIQRGIKPSALATVLKHSTEWMVLGTNDDKVYYVNTSNQGTTWELPAVTPKTPPPEQAAPKPANGHTLHSTVESLKAPKPKKPKYVVVNGLTFDENEVQSPLTPNERSYVDHFWGDKGDQTGYDIILEKHLNGKFAMKDMMEFFKERAAIEEQYAKALLKLSKATLADNEEGTIGKTWQSIKAELRHRSEAHSKFAEKLQKEMEKPLFEFKESQKKGRKEHQQIMEKSRKQVQMLDASIDKLRGTVSGKPHKMKKQTSSEPAVDLKNFRGRRRASGANPGEDLRKLEENYNHAQRQWVDDMISACHDYEKQEDERSAYLKNHFLQYVDICCSVDEASAESLSRVTDAVDRINSMADREFFIKTRGTGTRRPVDRAFD